MLLGSMILTAVIVPVPAVVSTIVNVPSRVELGVHENVAEVEVEKVASDAIAPPVVLRSIFLLVEVFEVIVMAVRVAEVSWLITCKVVPAAIEPKLLIVAVLPETVHTGLAPAAVLKNPAARTHSPAVAATV